MPRTLRAQYWKARSCDAFACDGAAAVWNYVCVAILINVPTPSRSPVNSFQPTKVLLYPVSPFYLEPAHSIASIVLSRIISRVYGDALRTCLIFCDVHREASRIQDQRLKLQIDTLDNDRETMASAPGLILYGVLPLLFVFAVSEEWQRQNRRSREQPTPEASGQPKKHHLLSGLQDKVSLVSQSSPIAPRLIAADHIHDGKHHLLLACTGSVATIKLPQILSTLTSRHSNLSIKVLLTESARNFLQGQAEEQPSLSSLAALPGVDGIYFDSDEWREPWTRGAHILHIELRRWADLMVIAPLSANSLAKLANGYSDNLISSVVRAWDTTGLIDGGSTLR